jgi:hypothetical protein
MITLEPDHSDILKSRGIAHGFFGRRSGVSKDIFTSLNCGPGSGDHRFCIIENRARIADHFSIKSGALLSLSQIHSPQVLEVHQPWASDARPQADAMVTKEPGLAISILTADCGPVLFADPAAGVIGAAHAGWKGAFGGVLEATVDEMIGLGAARANICAALGPTISSQAYEVGPEFVERFLARSSTCEIFFAPSTREGHAYFDLPAFIMARLEDLAIGQTRDLGLCTYTFEDAFFSYRRTTHRSETHYGRNISVIKLEGGA